MAAPTAAGWRCPLRTGYVHSGEELWPGADQRLPRRRLLRRLQVFQRLPPATVIADPNTGRCTASATACVFGVPAGYVPVSAPINPAVIGGDPSFNNTNNVYVPLKNGAQQLVGYDTGLNPYRNQWSEGPWLTNLSASVPITEKVKLRINLDAFNVLNQPGLPAPSSEGIISLRTSAQGARVLQYTARLSWCTGQSGYASRYSTAAVLDDSRRGTIQVLRRPALVTFTSTGTLAAHLLPAELIARLQMR